MIDETLLLTKISEAWSKGYYQGREDAINELYSHRCKEMQDDTHGEQLVCIWKSWFDLARRKK